MTGAITFEFSRLAAYFPDNRVEEHVEKLNRCAFLSGHGGGAFNARAGGMQIRTRLRELNEDPMFQAALIAVYGEDGLRALIASCQKPAPVAVPRRPSLWGFLPRFRGA